MAIACALTVCIGQAHARDDAGRVRLADGSVVTVPRTGPLADDRAIALAQQIAAVDDRVGRGVVETSDSGIRDAVLESLVEARNVAADKLGLAYRIATSTSAGTLDVDVLRQGTEALRNATDALSRPPTRLYMRTQISSLMPDYALEYVTAAEFRRNEDVWRNYTSGQPMKYGDYVFRLLRSGGDRQPIIKRLEVKTDPTVQVLEPRTR